MSKWYPLKLYIKYPSNIVFFSIAGALNIATWVWIVWNIRPQTEPVFLHYNILYGVDLIGSWYKVFYLPLLGLGIFLFNSFFGWFFFHKDPFIAQIANAVAVICQIFLFLLPAECAKHMARFFYQAYRAENDKAGIL